MGPSLPQKPASPPGKQTLSNLQEDEHMEPHLTTDAPRSAAEPRASLYPRNFEPN